jgi:hypothetical protein
MPDNRDSEGNLEDLLTKLLAVSMWSVGATQDVIAARLGKSKSWVNSLLQGVPRPNNTRARK